MNPCDGTGSCQHSPCPHETKNLPPKVIRYVWKTYSKVEGEETPRLLTPWSNPRVHEHPFDYVFDSEDEAVEFKQEHAPDEEDWILCKDELTPIRRS